MIYTKCPQFSLIRWKNVNPCNPFNPNIAYVLSGPLLICAEERDYSAKDTKLRYPGFYTQMALYVSENMEYDLKTEISQVNIRSSGIQLPRLMWK